MAVTSREWVAVRLELPEAAADAVANFLFERGATAVVDDTHFDPGPRPDATRQMEAHVLASAATAFVASLREYVAAVVALDAALGPIRIETAPVPATDWEAAFRAHHRPVVVGKRLLVAPPWDVPATTGREVIMIDPGMAFGTGQHATTRACLEELEELVERRQVGSVLDVGTGTGILAAAAARLGVQRVVAVDTDPDALPIARATLTDNRAAHVLLAAGGVDVVRGCFDVVLANLLADALIAEAHQLTARTTSTGVVVASGILEPQQDAVAAAFTPWRVEHVRAEGPWRTVRFARAA